MFDLLPRRNESLNSGLRTSVSLAFHDKGKPPERSARKATDPWMDVSNHVSPQESRAAKGYQGMSDESRKTGCSLTETIHFESFLKVVVACCLPNMLSPREIFDMKNFTQSIVNFLKEEDGPTAVEYAVMLALIVVVCLAAVGTIGTNAEAKFTEVGNAIGN
ncbi:Flp/Fap pilin component [Rubripirellula tenax]|uniref:Flp/Fap pilin component n=2 Tax=Rubripirellula tenax TaxID=2528015 RepID=A0A5C6FA68_9BACT|nr:Flp/Fap pilin component [Rubripirellula tenax]